MPQQTQKLKTGLQFRTFQLNREQADQEARTIPLSFSSENPVPRWYGKEVLDHSPTAVRLDRLRSGGPFLLDHDRRKQIGVIEEVTIGADRKGRAVVRFGKSTQADEVFQDVLDGIRTNISVGYLTHKAILESRDGDIETYRAVDWEPMEISSVSIPADASVGVGRQDGDRSDHETLIEIPEPHKENRTMPSPDTNAPTPPAADPAAVPETRAAAPAPAAPQVNENDILARERGRVREVDAIGEQFGHVAGVRDLVRQFRDNGQPIDGLRGEVMKRRGGPPPPAVPEPVGDLLNQREDKDYSLVRALNVAAYGGDGLEREVSDQIAKQLNRSTDGIFVPTSLSVRAPAVAGADAQGGYTVQTTVMPIIELLRNRMMVKRLGAQVLSGLVGNLAFPRQEGAPTLNWSAENPGSDTGDTDLTSYFGQVSMGPKSAIATIPYSKQLLAQSSADIEQFFRNDLTMANALGLDLAAIAGTGTNQPTGILNTTGIGSVIGGTNGLAPDWGHIVDLETEVAIDNADVGNLAYLTNAKVRGKLRQTEKASTTAQFIWEKGLEAGFGEMNGYRAGVSNQVASNLDKGTSTGVCSAIIYGNWEDLLIGEWGVIELIVDPYAKKKQGLVEITSTMLVDIAVRNPQSFAAMKDALTV